MKSKKNVQKALERIKSLDTNVKVQFVILYGSMVKNKTTDISDIDIAIGYAGSPEERFRFRMNVLGELPKQFDVHIFQDLPLYIKKDVLDGKVLYSRDTSELYEIALHTIQDFAFFEPRFLDYIHR
ncbi:MAG: nucleotidyltransferase domain-containing protein [Candidatus Korarchaeota archaeon]|nr:nucleotidyltransferase domain-containing protein [Candidatus Korarchaeota archaeon]NIU85543.1 nucleotidyltransferase domain-containing protein [Candidatus Thorarchaeota archaeon]NIW53584.1 nucleotidyltransferase domain-containing protein [Candidatus Korarchaeota archaeon]